MIAKQADTTFSANNRFGWKRYGLILVLLGLSVHVILPQLTSLDQTLSVISQMPVLLIGVAVLAQKLSYMGLAIEMKFLIGIFNIRFSLLKSLQIILASSALGAIGAGAVTRSFSIYHWTKTVGVSAEGAISIAILPTLMNVLSLSAVSIFGLAYLLFDHKLTAELSWGFASAIFVLLLLFVLILWSYTHRPTVTRALHFIGESWSKLRKKTYNPLKTEQWVEKIYTSFSNLLHGNWKKPVQGEVLNVFFDLLTLYFIFWATGEFISFGILLAGYGIPLLLLGKATFLPGGIGVVEGSMAGLYHLLGVPAPVMVIVILSYRLLSFWLPTTIGIMLILWLEHRTGKRQNHPT